MLFEDENDYIMRSIKQIVRLLLSVVLGKNYMQEEFMHEKWKAMIDEGKINEAENMLLDGIDYSNKEDIAEAIFFYEYASKKGNDFLTQHNYSEKEVLDGLKQLVVQSGYEDLADILM